jgi:hypothetical protein
MVPSRRSDPGRCSIPIHPANNEFPEGCETEWPISLENTRLTSLAEMLGLPPRLSGSGVGVRLFESDIVQNRFGEDKLFATTFHFLMYVF